MQNELIQKQLSSKLAPKIHNSRVLTLILNVRNLVQTKLDTLLQE